MVTRHMLGLRKTDIWIEISEANIRGCSNLECITLEGWT
jgi:hypothetical protein